MRSSQGRDRLPLCIERAARATSKRANSCSVRPGVQYLLGAEVGTSAKTPSSLGKRPRCAGPDCAPSGCGGVSALLAALVPFIFTAGVLANPNATAIVRAILSLGYDLDLLVIAEGIETPDQKAAMYDLGCWIGQGYLFAKPQPGARVALSRSDLAHATRTGRST